jgi:type I restriction enzyme S subunit
VDLPNFPVTLPSVDVQRRLAAAIGAYDDLIENNKRRIRILEDMAQAIYREWFIELRFPGSEGATLVDSAIGPIPAGWKASRLVNLVDEVRASVDPRTVDPDTPYFGLEHLPEHSMAIESWGAARDAGSRKYLFEPMDILFGKIRPYFHKVGIPPVSGICSTDAIVLRPRDESVAGLVLSVVSSDPFVAHAVQTSQGTKMPRATWSVLEQYPVAVPGDALLARFSDHVEDTVALIHSLLLANRTLRAMRDLLLPRLISGELDVSHVDLVDERGLVA